MATDKSSLTQHTLRESRFYNAEQRRNMYFAILPEGDTQDDIIQPRYWSHVARKLRAFDLIEVVAEDSRFWAQLLVLRASSTEAVVKIYNYVDLDPNLQRFKDIELEGMLVSWKGEQEKFAIIRAADKVVVRSGIATRSLAMQEAIQYAKTLAA